MEEARVHSKLSNMKPFSIESVLIVHNWVIGAIFLLKKTRIFNWIFLIYLEVTVTDGCNRSEW